MAEKNTNEIPRAARDLFEKGNAALARNNLDYALTIFIDVLKKEPAFLECREALRTAQAKKSGSSTSFFKKVMGSANPMVAKGQIVLRNNPLEALQIGEQILNGDCNSVGAHKLIADAALAADLPRTALISLEIVRRLAPKDRDAAIALANAYAKLGQISKGEAIYSELLRANPNDGELAMAYKNMSAARTMGEGGYAAVASGEGSYRDMLKDKDQAATLEQEQRQVKSEDVALKLLDEYVDRLQKDPNDLRLARQVADLYAQTKNYDKALKYYTQLASLESGADPTLEKAISNITLKQYDQQIEALDAGAPDYEIRRDEIQRQKDEFLLVDCKRRADKYPNDLQIRFELGQLYFKTGKITEAIQEFQRSQKDGSRRIQSLLYLGRCFADRGMNDLAAKTLETAIKEKTGFDDEKKELIYSLGTVLEKMGKPDAAIEEFKKIYEADIGYRDIAAKVDAYYASK